MNRELIKIGFSVILLIFAYGLKAQDDLTEEFEKMYLQRQPPGKIMALLGVKPGMTIGEVGAGRGRMTVYFAKEVGPSGKIYANDIDELSQAYLKGRCRRLGITNVEFITSKPDDPLLPEKSLDMAVMVLVYHMIDKPDKLLENLKKSLRNDAYLIIIDPVDELIDREFGIDRSTPGMKPPTIKERIRNSAIAAGYDIGRIDTSLSSDLIFFLKPVKERIKAGDLLTSMVLGQGINTAQAEFAKIKGDTLNFDLSEMEFRTAGYEFIGSRSYPEAVAILEMGIELYPESSMLFAEMGEAYLMQGNKEKSLESWKRAASLDPDNPDGKYLIENFDAVFEEIHPEKK